MARAAGTPVARVRWWWASGQGHLEMLQYPCPRPSATVRQGSEAETLFCSSSAAVPEAELNSGQTQFGSSAVTPASPAMPAALLRLLLRVHAVHAPTFSNHTRHWDWEVAEIAGQIQTQAPTPSTYLMNQHSSGHPHPTCNNRATIPTSVKIKVETGEAA